MSVLGKILIFPTLEKGGKGGFKDGKRQGNVLMTVLLKPKTQPASKHEVHPAPRWTQCPELVDGSGV